MEPKFNLWIEQDGVVVLSPWRLRLLEAIDATGSISAAAEQLKIPYRRAWEKLQEMEQGLGSKLVETAVGGAGGGGAQLTAAGRETMARFRAFAAGFDQAVAERYAAAFTRADPASPPPGASSASER
jgi:molybdate transport system regulatory protein